MARGPVACKKKSIGKQVGLILLFSVEQRPRLPNILKMILVGMIRQILGQILLNLLNMLYCSVLVVSMGMGIQMLVKR